MDPYDEARVGRRQVLRWGGGLALAAAVGCGPLRTEPAAPRRAAPAAGTPRNGGDGAATADARATGPTPTDPRSGVAGPDDPRRGAATGDELPDEDERHAGDRSSDAAHPAATVEVLCRDAVGLAAAAPGGRPHRLRQLTLHHSALPLVDARRAPAQLRRHQRFHLDQGWSDIAYHFAVDLRGNVYELRDPGLAGDTFTAYDPAGHLGVVCEGDFDQQRPTDAMLEAAALLLAHAATEYGMDPGSLSGHREHTLTRCPGDHLAARLPELRDAAIELAADAVQRRDVCGAAGRARVERIAQGR